MQKAAIKSKYGRRLRRKRHVRRRVSGTPERPRLNVHRTLAHIYAQIIDDYGGRTLCAASTTEKDLQGSLKRKGNCEAAEKVGLRLAEKAREAGIKRVVFDRAGFRYHGRVKALATGARQGGLEF